MRIWVACCAVSRLPVLAAYILVSILVYQWITQLSLDQFSDTTMAAPSDIISAIALKIEQGEDDILPCELDQLRVIASMDEKVSEQLGAHHG